MSGKLTPNQRDMLSRAAKYGSCTVYKSEATTLLSLTKRGLMTWVRNGGEKYGHGASTARATITEAGRALLTDTQQGAET